MQSEGDGCVTPQLIVNVIYDALVAAACAGCTETLDTRGGLQEREKGHFVQQLVLHVELQVTRRKQSVEVVDDVAAVHDLSEEVSEILPGDLPRRVLHVVAKHGHGAHEILNAEWVHHIVALGAKFLALHHNGMELAQAEENALGARLQLLEEIARKTREGLLEVGLESRGGVRGDLDGAIENTDGDGI